MTHGHVRAADRQEAATPADRGRLLRRAPGDLPGFFPAAGCLPRGGEAGEGARVSRPVGTLVETPSLIARDAAAGLPDLRNPDDGRRVPRRGGQPSQSFRSLCGSCQFSQFGQSDERARVARTGNLLGELFRPDEPVAVPGRISEVDAALGEEAHRRVRRKTSAGFMAGSRPPHDGYVTAGYPSGRYIGARGVGGADPGGMEGTRGREGTVTP